MVINYFKKCCNSCKAPLLAYTHDEIFSWNGKESVVEVGCPKRFTCEVYASEKKNEMRSWMK